jgi:uncharacterized protein (DUF362 family)
MQKIEKVGTVVSLRAVNPQAMTNEIAAVVRRVLDDIGAVEMLRARGPRVLIKPNISSPGTLTSTNPSVTYAVARILAEEGFEVMLGENPAIPVSAKKAYAAYGLDTIAEAAGARLVHFRSGPHTAVPVPGGSLFRSLMITDYALNADSIISVAAMKAVNIVTATLSVKNMKGVIPSEYKRKFHCEGLNDGITDLMRVVKPALAIIDGTLGRDTATGTCFPVGLLIGSKDPIAADAVCARIMGFDPAEIEHLKKCAAAGLGVIDRDGIKIVGEDSACYEGRFPFSLPKDPLRIAAESGGKLEIIQGNPCSACMNQLGNILDAFRGRFRKMPEITILVGPEASSAGVDPGRTVIGFGSCARGVRDSGASAGDSDAAGAGVGAGAGAGAGILIAGCPPTEYEAAGTGSLGEVLNALLEKERD